MTNARGGMIMPPTPKLPRRPERRPREPGWGAVIRDLLRVEWTVTLVGVVIYLFVIMTYLIPVGDIASIGIGIALLGLVVAGNRVRFPPVCIAFIVYLGWAFFGSAVALYPSVTQAKLLDLTKVGLIMLALVNAAVSPRQLRLVLVMFLTAFVMFPARGTIFNYFLYSNTVMGGRAAWRDMFSNPNDMASLCLFPLALAIGYSMTATLRVTRIASGIAIGLISLALLLTQSRGGFIAAAFFLALVIVTQKRNRTRTMVVGALLGTIVIIAAPGGVFDRMLGLKKVSTETAMTGVDPEGSAAERWAIWETAADIIESHPLNGIGFGGYPRANARFNPTLGARDSHSTYLNVAAETGLLSLPLFLAMFVVVIANAHKVRKSLPPPMIGEGRRLQLVEFSLYGYLVAGIWGSYGKVALLYITLGLFTCMTAALARQRTQFQRMRQSAGLKGSS